MLIGFGLWHLVRGHAVTEHALAEASSTPYARPILIGLVHGLAGSAGIALMAATTITSRPVAAAYLGLFALGTILGMVALTIVISRPISWTVQRGGRVKQAVTVVAALLSMGLGAAILVRSFAGSGP